MTDAEPGEGVLGPREGPAELVIRPAAVIELCYAYYRLLGPSSPNTPLPWLRELRDHPPKWLATLPAADTGFTGYEALLLACAFGYEDDESPERFLGDLPSLPGRLLAEFTRVFDPARFEDDPDDPRGSYAALKASFEALDGAAASCLAENLGHLWSHLRAAWEDGGVQVTAAASRDLRAAVRASNDLARSLPVHHFVSFEENVADIRAFGRQGRTLVVPLYFATRGGFKFQVRSRLCIGYGVRSEDIYEEQKEGVVRLANRLKAFADPTRLLLLLLIARLPRFPLTVGDLAKQLNVTQPTASGHLRLLRELELVQVVKRGNRSYYRLDRDAVKEILAALEETLAPPD
ncbi:MAG: metalloregulator ArsR/SmtB family transcription factor [Truepera sp.]|jgi:ArsR family transcriptional regulator|nr:metalloregulator ArsR/SmtB family transcription factor [Truepera sp.]HRQ10793.1 metalloregulator ArsR/SmtB family transcription factor [Trueperaceae bacterium]